MDNELTNEELITLLSVYQNEFIHRDEILWKQCFRFFSASVAVILLPYIKIWDVDFENKVPKWIFPIIGIVCQRFFYMFQYSMLLDSQKSVIVIII